MGGTLPVGLSCLGIELLMAFLAFPVSGRPDRHHRVARSGGWGGPRVCPAVLSVPGPAKGAHRRQDQSFYHPEQVPCSGGACCGTPFTLLRGHAQSDAPSLTIQFRASRSDALRWPAMVGLVASRT